MEYTITAISNFGGFGSSAWDINEEGTVIGRAGGQGYLHAMRFKNNGVTDLTPGQNITSSEAHGINNLPQEQIVGEYSAGGNTKSFLWNNGVFTDLHQVLGGNYSIARDINDAGLIVGTRGAPNNTHAFLYDLNTNAITTPFPSSTLDFGNTINANGHMVGRAFDLPQGYVYNGTVDFLPTLGGNATDPNDINDIGLIVGASKTAGGDWHAFVYDPNGIHDIHGLGTSYSKALSINNHNVIVGEVTLEEGIEAFIREPGKDMVKLASKINNPGGWGRLWRATGINDDGAICGTGIFNGTQHAFLLTPVKKSLFDKLKEVDLPILVATILFGVGTGGGGLIVVGGKIIPIDPPLPYKDLIARNRRELGHLMAQQLSVTKKGETRNIERLIKEVYEQGVKNHRKFHQGSLK